MLNVFIIKKYGALLFASMFTVICFFVGVQFYGFWVGLILLFIGMSVGILTANALLKNPFSDMLEGKGILVFDVNSTGILKPFIVQVAPPMVRGIIDGKEVHDTFDRSAVNMLTAPIKNSTAAQPITEGEKQGGIRLELDENTFNAARFALFHYPVLLYNSQLGTFLTKDFLSEQEKTSFAEHGILLLNRRMEELSRDIKNFGRYVVELTKPIGRLLQNKWFWIILLIGMGVLAVLFAPSLIATLKGTAGTVSASVNAAAASGAVTPR